ncbi:hypothetical protein QR680_000213 [Steinernema hermaphroditum]|uniref:SAM domain-containing protein n=1 Tax=Steinernema hermaphroditum TaxID=289476 RepID=A0AA39LDQ4_9BILA|nr:hypothetical protein QR680_000213 [Steinernema hermaphroditum]
MPILAATIVTPTEAAPPDSLLSRMLSPASQPSTSSPSHTNMQSIPPTPPPSKEGLSASPEESSNNQKGKRSKEPSITRTGNQQTNSITETIETIQDETPLFTWTAYLLSTKSIAAPEECFFQSKKKLTNNFKIGYKLVVPDPRGLGTNCLATIIRIYKAWICVRLDGEDTSNDHWIVCDDSQLCPVRDGGEGLQPPVGFTRNPANFRMFVNRQLNLDKDGQSVLCSESWFTPIDSSCCPEENLFLPGMKCELVERRNFSGAPCVVTVSEVHGDTLLLSFDGSSDHVVKEHFQSRYIYPCGWGERNEAPVIPPVFPGPKRTKRKSNVGPRITPKMAKEPRSKKARLTVEALDTSASQAVSATRNDEEKPQNGIKVELISEEARTPSTPNSSLLPQRASSSGVQMPVQENNDDSPPSTSSTASGLPQLAAAQPSTTTPAPSEVHIKTEVEPPAKPVAQESIPEEPKEPPASIPEDPEAKPAPPTVMDQPKPKRIMKTARKGKRTYQRTNSAEKKKKNENGVPDEITIYINHGCAHKSSLLDMRRVMDLPKRIGPTAPHHLYREIIQGLLNSVPRERIITAWNKLPVGNCKKLTVTACIKHMTYTHYLPVPSSASACIDIVRTFMNSLGVCKNFISTTGERCNSCFRFVKRPVPPPPEYHSWSVEQTAQFVAAEINTELKNIFIHNEIDGRAMSLLTQQNIMDYMKLSLGVAMKIVSILNQLNQEHEKALRHQFAS